MAHEEMHIQIKSLQPATYDVNVTGQTTVNELKCQVEILSGIPVGRQRLIYRGNLLRDDQTMTDTVVENGSVLHLVERPESQVQAETQQPDINASESRWNVVDLNSNLLSNMPQFLSDIPQPNAQVQIVTHPPMSANGTTQVVQVMPVLDNSNENTVHQMVALETFLRQNLSQTSTSLPPFSFITRAGGGALDENMYLDTLKSILGRFELPPHLQNFVASVGSNHVNASSIGQDNQRSGVHHQRYNLSSDVLRLSAIALTHISRQTVTRLQSEFLPTMADAANRLLQIVEAVTLENSHLLNQSRTLSNVAYQMGSLLLEYSLSMANLAQAAAADAGPLICAQAGFLSSNGDHAQVSNRLPNVESRHERLRHASLSMPNIVPGITLSDRQGVRPSANNLTTDGRVRIADGIRSASRPNGMHSFVGPMSNMMGGLRSVNSNIIPVAMPSGTEVRVDVSGIIYSLETLILTTPGGDSRSLRELMTENQSTSQRQQLYNTFSGPIIREALRATDQYLRQLYHVPIQEGDQPCIRPSERAMACPVPSLSQLFFSPTLGPVDDASFEQHNNTPGGNTITSVASSASVPRNGISANSSMQSIHHHLPNDVSQVVNGIQDVMHGTLRPNSTSDNSVSPLIRQAGPSILSNSSYNQQSASAQICNDCPSLFDPIASNSNTTAVDSSEADAMEIDQTDGSTMPSGPQLNLNSSRTGLPQLPTRRRPERSNHRSLGSRGVNLRNPEGLLPIASSSPSMVNNRINAELQQLLPPQFGNIINSPLMNQMTQNIFGNNMSNSERSSNAPEFNRLFQTLMPIAERMIQGSRNTSSSSSLFVNESQSSTNLSNPSDLEFPNNLDGSVRQRWQAAIMGDRERQQSINQSVSAQYQFMTGKNGADTR